MGLFVQLTEKPMPSKSKVFLEYTLTVTGITYTYITMDHATHFQNKFYGENRVIEQAIECQTKSVMIPYGDEDDNCKA